MTAREELTHVESSKICSICKKRFSKQRKRSKKSWMKAKYCSPECDWKSKKDKMPENIDMLIKCPPWNKGKRTGLIPKSAYKEGSKHKYWQGGISFEPYGLTFNKRLKLKIRTRDNFTCQECNYTEKQLGYALATHHVDYNKKNNREKNLIALCKSCHSRTNFNRKDWTNYFNKKVSI